MFRFQKLHAWQKAMDWAQRIYTVTDSFPDHERFGLTAHLRKSAFSVPSNIAEGSARTGVADPSKDRGCNPSPMICGCCPHGFSR